MNTFSTFDRGSAAPGNSPQPEAGRSATFDDAWESGIMRSIGMLALGACGAGAFGVIAWNTWSELHWLPIAATIGCISGSYYAWESLDYLCCEVMKLRRNYHQAIRILARRDELSQGGKPSGQTAGGGGSAQHLAPAVIQHRGRIS